MILMYIWFHYPQNFALQLVEAVSHTMTAKVIDLQDFDPEKHILHDVRSLVSFLCNPFVTVVWQNISDNKTFKKCKALLSGLELIKESLHKSILIQLKISENIGGISMLIFFYLDPVSLPQSKMPKLLSAIHLFVCPSEFYFVIFDMMIIVPVLPIIG